MTCVCLSVLNGSGSFRLDGVERALARHGVPVRVLTTTTPGREGAPAPVPDDPEGVRVSRWPALRDASGYLRGYLPYMSYDLPVALRLRTASRPNIVSLLRNSFIIYLGKL